MEKKSRSNSNISLDSLEIDNKRKPLLKGKVSDENVDTILVPFYENDVLIKVPKGKKKQRQIRDKHTKKDAHKGETQQYKSYLMNKNMQKNKKSSYLDMFRKQFAPNFTETDKKNPNEIRSISPEFGDTERESIGEDCNNNIASEFYNTESYNEIYYEKLMNQELEQYLDQSFEEILHLNEDIRSKSPEDINNLRSISEVSRPRRHVRRSTVPVNQNIRLGGLGPDVENIRPRLERAKSLQRYSEKVRMENRLKLYKKAVEAENEKKAEKLSSAKSRGLSENKNKNQKSSKKSSYLVNKTTDEKSLSIKKKAYGHSKSADTHKIKSGDLKETDNTNKDYENLKNNDIKPNRIERKLLSAKDSLQKYLKASYEATKIKSSARSQTTNIEEKQKNEVSPVEIRVMVNVGGIRPSCALKSLEEKHRLYQEKVKEFTMESNNI